MQRERGLYAGGGVGGRLYFAAVINPGESSSREIAGDGRSGLHNARPAARATFPRRRTGRRYIERCISYLGRETEKTREEERRWQTGWRTADPMAGSSVSISHVQVTERERRLREGFGGQRGWFVMLAAESSLLRGGS